MGTIRGHGPPYWVPAFAGMTCGEERHDTVTPANAGQRLR